MLLNPKSNTQEPVVLNETTIGSIKNNKFRVDVTFDRSKHGPRIKIVGKGSTGFGTSVPISKELGTNPSFDELINHENVKRESSSVEYLPLLTGFAVTHYDELLAMSDFKVDSTTREKYREKLKDEWSEYYDEFSDCSKHAIKIAADKFLEDKK